MTDQLTTTSILALFQTTKEQRSSFVNDILNKIDSGELNPLQAHLQIKCMEDIIEQITIAPNYKHAVLEESQKYGQKEFEYHNAKISIKEVGTKYDFSNTGDTVYQMLEQQKLSAENALKERQKFLKTVPEKGMTIADDLTGEMITVYPPAKTSTTSIAVSLK